MILNDCTLSSCSQFNFHKITPLFKILGSASLIHLPRLLLFDQKYSNIVKYYNLKQLFSILILKKIESYDGKATFSASILQSSVSRDPSEVIYTCQHLRWIKKVHLRWERVLILGFRTTLKGFDPLQMLTCVICCSSMLKTSVLLRIYL